MSLRIPACALVVAAFTLGGCAASAPRPSATNCPSPVGRVVVTVDQWADITRSLGGDCVRVTVIVSGAAGDPHDYETTPADAAAFSSARLVVKNGLNYDEWAQRAVAALSPRPVVIDAAIVVGAVAGDNPHLWYSPDAIERVSTAITAALVGIAPGAGTYFSARHHAWASAITPYRDAVARARTAVTAKTYAATEPVFDLMASALAMRDLTPAGFQRAAANNTEPGPADILAFQKLIRAHSIAVLIFNSQTQGSLPDELRREATTAQIPVVDVTETVRAGSGGFVEWQVAQLAALTSALS